VAIKFRRSFRPRQNFNVMRRGDFQGFDDLGGNLRLGPSSSDRPPTQPPTTPSRHRQCTSLPLNARLPLKILSQQRKHPRQGNRMNSQRTKSRRLARSIPAGFTTTKSLMSTSVKSRNHSQIFQSPSRPSDLPPGTR
jgi:hypothetical protein